MCSCVRGAKGGAKGKAACWQMCRSRKHFHDFLLGPFFVVIGAKVAVPGRTPGASTTKDDDEMEVHIGLSAIVLAPLLHVQRLFLQRYLCRWIMSWPRRSVALKDAGIPFVHELGTAKVIPEVLAGNDQPEDETFAAIMERFKYVEPENKVH